MITWRAPSSSSSWCKRILLCLSGLPVIGLGEASMGSGVIFWVYKDEDSL